MLFNEEDYLAHYGVLRRSGRYPWGSGKTQDEVHRSFLGTVEEMRTKHGMSETEIAKGFGMSTTQLRDLKSIARIATKQADINMAQRLHDKGWSNIAIGKRMERGESSVRALLKPGELDKAQVLDTTVSMLKDAVTKNKYVDVGSGVERHLNLTRKKLDTAITALREEGYTLHPVQVEQIGTGKNTSMKILAAPGTEYSEVYKNRDNIKPVMSYMTNGGRDYDSILRPLSVSPKRIAVRYAEQGGTSADGVIYVRPGVKDLSLGASRYAQVRIAVGGTHYLKGMAMYKNDLPEGVDLMFNTNKSNTGNKLDAMKKMKDDPDDPFGAVISRQIQAHGSDGKKHVTSAMNIVNEEGDWEKWAKSLSAQMLSKQSPKLAKAQLDMTYERKKNELDELKKLVNPAIKKKLLESFADDADSSAIHLKAAALPSQGSHVILPISSMKETEVYAPNFHDGERVVLIRYPHGGIFEIPELTVNNRHPEARALLGTNAKDAIGIHHKVAEKLSGADFDGDTVLVIPNNDGKIKTAPTLEGLKGFDPQRAYPEYEGMPRMSPKSKQVEMGKITNLINDMTIKRANMSELARAVRHSMVIIDAEKHHLDYRLSAKVNGIAALKKKYQGPHGGASTLISNSGFTSTDRIPDRKERRQSQGGPIDKVTGKKVYESTNESYVLREDKLSKTGRVLAKAGTTIEKKIEVPRLSIVDDAHTLSSGTPIEKIYADHSNRIKELANQARLETLSIKPTPYSSAAKEAHSSEVRSLEAKLNLALRNSPLERQAQVIANAIVRQKTAANPDLDKSEIKKLKSKALTEARNRTGAKKQEIEISDAEWKAIQAGAISTHKLDQILNNADLTAIKQLATPKTTQVLSSARKSQAVNMLRNGYTQAEVASALGVNVATLKRSLSGGA